MAAFARQVEVDPQRPRLVGEGMVGPAVRLRTWVSGTWSGSHAAAHAGVELTWLGSGAISYDIGRASFAVDVGTAILVPSEVEHTTQFHGSMCGTALWIDRDLVANVGDAIGLAYGPVIGLLREGTHVAALGALLVREVSRADQGALLAADAILEAMLVAALRRGDEARPANDSPRDPAIANAVRFIAASYADPITVDDIARAAGMSRYHFSRRFRDVMKASPYRHLLDVRLGHAAELLRRGRHGVTEVAFAVGFNDPSRFAKSFRARFGAAPARFASETRTRVAFSHGPAR
jgi:AraC-like DNA-binding protein